MTSDVIGVPPETSFSDAMAIMGEKKISCVLVLEDKRPIGILTERSIVSYAARHKRDINTCQSQELMSSPVLTAHRAMELDAAYELLMNKRIRHLVVVDDEDRAVGVVTLSNIIEHLGYDYFVEMKKTSQIMTKIPYILSRDVIVHEAMGEMAARSISCLIIVEGKQPIGILTERDMIRLLNKSYNLRELKVEDVMSRPVYTIFGDAPVLGASRMMKQKKIRRLVVVDDQNELLGLITQYDIVKGVEVRYIEQLKHDVKKKDLEIVDALRELGEKNVYLDNLLSSSVNMGIAATDLGGNITHYNPAAERIIGVPAESVIGRDVREFHRYLDLDLARFDKIIEKVQENKVHTFSFTRRDKSGVRYITARVSGIRNQVHRLVGLMLTCQDVTERRQAEEVVNRNNQILNVINRLLNLSLENYSLREIMDSFLLNITSLPCLDLRPGGAAFLMDADTKTLRMVSHSGLPDAVRKKCSSLLLGRCLCGRAALTGELVFVSDIKEQHEVPCREIGPHGHYCVPFLSAAKEVLGVYSIHLREGGSRDHKTEETLLAAASVMAGIIERTLAREALQKRTHELAKRVKELNCLHSISKLIEKTASCVDEILQRIADLIPAAWQYPEIAWARIIVNGREYKTNNFMETPWRQRCEILTHGRSSGLLEVGYLEERPAADEGPFQKEERALLHTIAERLVNIIEQKQADEALKESLAIQQTIIDGGTESIMVIDRDHRVRMINKVIRQLHLTTPEQDTHAMFCYQIMHQVTRPCSGKYHRCPMREVIETKKPCTVIHTHAGKDNTKYQVEIIASPILNEQGEVTGIIEVGRDITKRLLLEEERKKIDERFFLQQKAESIATLAGGVAHDFNNILTIVLGNAALLKRTVTSDQEQCQFIDAIIFATQRMAQLIRQLLAYANSGKGPVKYFPNHESRTEIVSLNQLMNEALELTAKEKDIYRDMEIVRELAPDLWPVDVDSGQARQMLVNILLNAFESMGKGGGRLTVKSANVVKRKKWTCVHHDDHPGGDYVRVSIADTGTGIPRDIRGRIFEPFFSTKFVGRGLGLAAALGIARNHGGCITVATHPPHGTVFDVLLPRA